jgi:diguanylate cyclase (GGDEF)-like protein/PAS domain S-box-containing protein
MRFRSLKTKITLAVTASFVVVVALVSLVQTYSAKSGMQQLLQAQQFTLVTMVAQDIDEKIALRLQSLSSVAKILPVGSLSRPRLIRENLDNQPDLQGQFDALAVVAPSGRVLAAIPSEPDRLTLTLADRPWFSQVMERRSPLVSDPVRSRVSGDPQVVLAAPIFGPDGEVAGVLAGTLNLFKPNFLGGIGSARIGNTGSFALFTRDRVILMSRERDRIMTPGPAPGVSPSFDRATAGAEGFEESVNSRGMHALFSYKQLRTVPWVLVAALPVDEVYAPVAAAQRHLVLMALLMILLLAPLLWLGTRRLVSPLLLLHDAIRRIRAGSGDVPDALVRRADEIGQLAADFGAMVREGRAAERALRESELRLSLAMEGSQLALFDWDVVTGEVFLSERWSVILGGAPAVVRTSFAELAQTVHPDDFPRLRIALAEVLKGAKRHYLVEHRVRNAAGAWVWVQSHGEVTARDAAGRALRLVGTNADIGERKRAEQALLENRAELERAARYDPLTGLPNRKLFEDRLAQALARSRRSGHPVALLYVDLDGFKAVNDDFGHAAGDLLLKQFAAHLSRCVRKSDTVARMGGDEFVILLDDMNRADDAGAVAGKIVDSLAPELDVGTGRARVTTSIGIAIASGDVAAEELLRRADEALYEAKRAGRNRVHLAAR